MANTRVIHDISIGRSVGFNQHNSSFKRKCSETKSRDILLRYCSRSFKDMNNEQSIIRSALIVMLFNNPQFGYCVCELVYDQRSICPSFDFEYNNHSSNKREHNKHDKNWILHFRKFSNTRRRMEKLYRNCRFMSFRSWQRTVYEWVGSRSRRVSETSHVTLEV